MKIGILALQGDVIEHLNAVKKASVKLKIKCEIVEVRIKKDFEGLDALIIPGGESTTLMKLIEREGIAVEIKNIKNIFGTCAGAILLSKSHFNLMDIEVKRNAYGSQIDSFEEKIDSKFGEIGGIFIRAPRIVGIGSNVDIIAKSLDKHREIFGVEQKKDGRFYIALSFHPELNSTRFHEYFLEQCLR
ncbi:MAG: pyridoxal 5'-phosphate synthase glutaminase subunit PdxT [Candidatus ainarchaeum sp.]|nr:pyridoxal 5'-phosphate synthase glutaminase subunit PdxT [Candidatus ainarchaeum sp.]